jgi:ribosomal protein S18 acetylase RimI-like enzyme
VTGWRLSSNRLASTMTERHSVAATPNSTTGFTGAQVRTKDATSRASSSPSTTASVSLAFSLSSFTLGLTDLPDAIARKLPRYDAIPAARIGRLARDVRMRGHGIGELLLANAISRILAAGSTLAVFAIVVDAKDAAAATFYEEFGFRAFPSRPDRLFLPASTAAAAIEKI